MKRLPSRKANSREPNLNDGFDFASPSGFASPPSSVPSPSTPRRATSSTPVPQATRESPLFSTPLRSPPQTSAPAQHPAPSVAVSTPDGLNEPPLSPSAIRQPDTESHTMRIAQLEASLDMPDAGAARASLCLASHTPPKAAVLTGSTTQRQPLTVDDADHVSSVSATGQLQAPEPVPQPQTFPSSKCAATALETIMPEWQQRQLLQLPAHLEALKMITLLQEQLETVSSKQQRASDDGSMTAAAVESGANAFDICSDGNAARERDFQLLNSQFEELTQKHATQDAELVQLRSQAIEMSGQVTALAQRGEEMAAMTESALAGMAQQFDETREMILQKNEQVIQTRAELDTANEELRVMQMQLQEKDEELAEYAEEWRQREEEVVEQMQANGGAQEMQQQAKGAAQEELEKQLYETEEQLLAVQQELLDVQQPMKQDLERCEEAVQLLQNAQQEIALRDDSLETISRQNRSQEQEIEQLKQQLRDTAQSDTAELQIQLVAFAEDLQEAQQELAQRDDQLCCKERVMRELTSCQENDVAATAIEAEVAVMERSQSSRDGDTMALSEELQSVRIELDHRDKEFEVLTARCIAKESALVEMEAQLSVMFAWRSLFRGERRRSEPTEPTDRLGLRDDELNANESSASELEAELQREERKVSMRDSALEDKNRELAEVRQICLLKEEELCKMEMKASHAVKAAEAWSAAWHRLSEQSDGPTDERDWRASSQPNAAAYALKLAGVSGPPATRR